MTEEDRTARFGEVDPVSDRTAIALDVLDQLPDLVWSRRAELGLTLRGAEASSGVPFNVIKRCEARDGGVTLTTAIKLLQWVGEGSGVNRRPDTAREPQRAALAAGPVPTTCGERNDRDTTHECRCVMKPGHMAGIPQAGHGCPCGEIWGAARDP
jgi:hypothetical protein